MATWNQFKAARPDLAKTGRSMFYQYGVGLAFLATIRKDGGPRLHPMCPILNDQGLFALIVPSQKRDDLIRDGRYAMHAFACEDNEDAFYITGRARLMDDPATRQPLVAQFCSERGGIDPHRVDDELSFAFDVESCLCTKTTGHGDWNPRHTVWKDRSAG
jgi:hypothetical protein